MPQSSVAPISSHITIVDGQPTTTTHDIAEVYGKNHRDVLRIVSQRMEESGEWGMRNFSRTPYTNPQNGQTYPVIRMTEKGFMFVVGKFTGAKAVQHQIAFVDEFERMKDELAKESQRNQMPVVQQQPDLATIERINRRAWNLAQVAFEDYRTRMMEDVLVKSGHTWPEDWEPVETSTEIIEMITATVNGLESMTRSLRRKAGRLEAAANHGKVSPQGASGLRKNLHKHSK